MRLGGCSDMAYDIIIIIIIYSVQDVLVLLDLIGTRDTVFANFFSKTQPLYDRLKDIGIDSGLFCPFMIVVWEVVCKIYCLQIPQVSCIWRETRAFNFCLTLSCKVAGISLHIRSVLLLIYVCTYSIE